ncbi:MAG: sigma-70 family RNA polymerase sigma factor [Bacteroidia bacterium]|jgi:RNA polymerase sigma factor (sigma-70 family)|nr:sigma-70 family RNA polymerase sigma factor [Bacteroidia bacterium]
MKSDSALIETVIRKQPDAAEQLYRRYGSKLAGYGMRQWSLNEDDAWELCYKTLYSVLENAHKYSFASAQKLDAFVFTVFLNNVRNHHRSAQAAGVAFVSLNEATPAMPQPQESPPENEALNPLREALDALADWERMLLLLRSQGVAYAEIEKLTGKPQSQLKVYYMRLKKRLHDQLSELQTRQTGKHT